MKIASRYQIASGLLPWEPLEFGNVWKRQILICGQYNIRRDNKSSKWPVDTHSLKIMKTLINFCFYTVLYIITIAQVFRLEMAHGLELFETLKVPFHQTIWHSKFPLGANQSGASWASTRSIYCVILNWPPPPIFYFLYNIMHSHQFNVHLYNA